jgi:hypothetical protein
MGALWLVKHCRSFLFAPLIQNAVAISEGQVDIWI